jgi:hypothetical protein
MCIQGPVLPLPTLPAPLSLSPPVPPALPGIPGLCCKLPISLAIPPIPIPSAVLNPAVIATLNGYIAVMKAYLRALPLPCPKE